MELRHLRYFVAVVEEGSMHAASRRLNAHRQLAALRTEYARETVAGHLPDVARVHAQHRTRWRSVYAMNAKL